MGINLSYNKLFNSKYNLIINNTLIYDYTLNIYIR